MSDLRTGLPWQMVEIHEPVRSLFIIETTAESMLRIMERNEGIRRLCRPRLDHPHADPSGNESGQPLPGRPVPGPTNPRPRSCPGPRLPIDWYRGWRDHLEFAEIEPEGPSNRGGRDVS